ncbi:MAG: aminotransferase class III-fold pyridoxal phosphate-dependent enzyme, partial [Oxalobacter sp.]|nr:aminotransferase class III-fold pyridoxal phosphate-dependent enzyme [Oxalobacter sp.]
AVSAASALEKLFEERAGKIAALIVEPLIQCAAGFAMYDPLYLKKARELCDRYQVHLIADEIAVGCGRTGTFFACEQAGIWPDFLTLSKGISGGYLPLSLVMTTNAIYRLFYSEEFARGFLHSHSYTGNPLACRAALATLDIFRDDAVLEKNQARAQTLTEKLAPLANHERIRHFRHCGMIWAFDVTLPQPEQLMAFPGEIFTAALDHEILLRPIGNTIYLMPPYILDEEEMAYLSAGTLATLEKVLPP